MADQDGTILQKIQAITAPPHPSPTSKQRRGKGKPPSSANNPPRQTGIDNHAYCDACGDGGDLLCCERCPASFHFLCCDPPLDPLTIPEGEWVCNTCRPSPAKVEGHKNVLFHSLLLQACSENPLTFSLPYEMMSITTFKDIKQEKKAKNEMAATQNIFCYLCERNSKCGLMIHCDFCPLSYHMDCLTPPLTHSPLPATWMCPNHIEHSLPALHDARLSNRLKALEECRADISRHSIKMDFLAKLTQIPHYKRITSRTNRRAMEVPVTIKALYAEPLNDTTSVSSLNQLLITASEQLEFLRKEGKREREKVQLCPTSYSTEERDEWTRHQVLESVKSVKSSAATRKDLEDILSHEPGSKTTTLCNGHMSTEDHINDNSKNLPSTSSISIDNLDDKLIRVLAMQRLQQLLPNSNSQEYKHLNGVNQTQPSTPPTLSPRKNLKRKNESDPQPSIFAILCPLSNGGPAVPLTTNVVTIGSGSEMDVCLTHYGHCNYISRHHACIIIDKESQEYELINYSEHGSIVDGVLYSCDFSPKTNDGTVLFLDDVTAMGNGRRAAVAKKRLEIARINLQDKDKAKKQLSAALKLSKSINKDCIIDKSQLAGIKRTRSTSASSDLSSPDSSITSPRSNDETHTNDPPLNNKHMKLETDAQPSPSTGRHLARPCLCKRSASSVIGNTGKGWEGAASVSHGSRLRFGCVQLVLSISGKPGHSELQQALYDSHLL